jgi:cardiolipin synthase
VPERSPERWPDLAGRRFFEVLLHAGVQFWIRPDPFLHAKAIVVDGEWSVVGSANFDQRSFHLNYETSCEIPDRQFAQDLEAYFAPDFELARRLDPEAFLARGWRQRLVENAAALFAPIL